MSEELTLLPCFNPECGCKEAIIHMAVITKKNMWFVECTKDACSMHGPAKFTKEEAIAAWNAIPRALTWTTEPPKVAGRYWCRHKGEGNTSWSVAYVPAVTDWEHYDTGEHDRIEWAGPIPLPKEPTP